MKKTNYNQKQKIVFAEFHIEYDNYCERWRCNSPYGTNDIYRNTLKNLVLCMYNIMVRE